MRRFSTVLRASVGGLLLVFAACSSSSSRTQESVSSTSEAVVTPTARVLSFEQPTTDWSASNLNLQQGNQFFDGTHSAAVTVVASGGKLTIYPMNCSIFD